MSDETPVGLTREQRAEFRSFVRTHHPDRGGDPEVFVAGLARFRELARPAPGPGPPGAGHRPAPDRYDAPIEFVRHLPLPARIAIALARTIHRRRHPRVDRPGSTGSTGSQHPRRTT